MEYNELKESHLEAAVREGDFPAEIRTAGSHVAVIMTQDWCPQWRQMRGWLTGLKPVPGAQIFYTEYNRALCFDRFRVHKEKVWQNGQIPYVRYYREGELIGVSNYVPEDIFRKKLSPEPDITGT